MSVTLNNAACENEYPSQNVTGSVQGTQLRAAPSAVAEVDVYNNAVYLQLLVSPTGDKGQATWMPELYMPPGHRVIVRKTIYGIRFRNAVENEIARVTVELIGEQESYLDYILGSVFR